MVKLKTEWMEKFVKNNYAIVKDRLLGRTKEDFDKLKGSKPSSQIFVGTLNENLSTEKRSKYKTMVAPHNLKAEFLLSKNTDKKAKIKIIPSAFFYYRVFPTFGEQRKHNIESLKESGKSEQDFLSYVEEDISRVKENKTPKYNFAEKILPVFKKINLPKKEVEISISEIFENRYKSFDFQDEIELITKKALKDQDIFYKKKIIPEDEEEEEDDKKKKKISFAEREKAEKIPLFCLYDEHTYQEELEKWKEKLVQPEWKLSINCTIKDFDADNFLVSIEFANMCDKRSSIYLERTIFDSKLMITLEGTEMIPFVVEYLKDDYKYDGRIYGKGENCNLNVIDKKIIETKHLATFEQKKLVPVTNVSTNDGKSYAATFKELSEDPIPLLKNILLSMKEELERSNALFKTRKESDENFSEDGQARFQEDISKFKHEIERFSAGIELIKEKEDIMYAFKLMNKAFLNSSKYPTWRIFQIIFIVMNIPDIGVSEYKGIPNYREQVDIVHFPTGGGKTESYLGLIIFTAFFDRIRGKKIGVSAWTKFPLRMLSLQQLERIGKIFASAELIRNEEKLQGEQFSVGYYVGSYNTPNKITDPYKEEDNIKLVNEIDPNKYLVISKCPFCGSKVNLRGDYETIRILHVCSNKDCPNPDKDNILPLYITDNECYRYLPTFIISTLDKITIIGTNKSFKQLYGQIKYKCPKHGYFFIKNKCIESCPKSNTDIKHCEVDPSEFMEIEPIKDPTPTLLIQDEMHLIREDFGTLDSHFESFLKHYQKKLSNGKEMKIIAATATITKYPRQIWELYLKKGYSFPFHGHQRDKSFYSYQKDELHRFVVGVVPHNRAIIWAHYYILKEYYKLIREYVVNPKKIIELDIGITTEEEALELINTYRNILSYHLSRREADTLKQSIETQVNEELEKEGIKRIKKEDITGDKDFKQIRNMLNLLSKKEITDEERIDLIIATKMISHGVDLEDLNFMSFMGMPRNNSEYIQAMSRVGRTFPGLVFITFNANRERDQSYYKYFEKFHDYKDLLVEAVPLTRWSKYSIEKTLPGLFSSAILNYFNVTKQDELYQQNIYSLIVGCPAFLKATEREFEGKKIIEREEIIEFLNFALQTDKDVLKPNFQEYIQKIIPKYFDAINKRPKNIFFPNAMRKGEFKVLSSLRDIGESCTVLVGNDAYIAKNVKPDISGYDHEKDEKDFNDNLEEDKQDD